MYDICFVVSFFCSLIICPQRTNFPSPRRAPDWYVKLMFMVTKPTYFATLLS